MEVPPACQKGQRHQSHLRRWKASKPASASLREPRPRDKAYPRLRCTEILDHGGQVARVIDQHRDHRRIGHRQEPHSPGLRRQAVSPQSYPGAATGGGPAPLCGTCGVIGQFRFTSQSLSVHTEGPGRAGSRSSGGRLLRGGHRAGCSDNGCAGWQKSSLAPIRCSRGTDGPCARSGPFCPARLPRPSRGVAASAGRCPATVLLGLNNQAAPAVRPAHNVSAHRSDRQARQSLLRRMFPSPCLLLSRRLVQLRP